MTRPRAGKPQGTLIVLASALNIMGSVMVAPVIPKIIAHFASGNPQAGLWVSLAVTGPALTIALFAPVAGWLADRFGRKNMLMLATVLYGLLGALPAFLDQLMLIVVARFTFGFAEATIMTCCTTLIGDYWQGEQRMLYVKRQVVTIGIVGSLFFFFGGLLGEHSWRDPFLLYLLPLVLVPAMLVVLWEPQRGREAERAATAEAEPTDLPIVATGYALIFISMVIAFVVTVQTPIVMTDRGIASSGVIGLTAGIALLASMVGGLVWPLTRKYTGINGTNAVMLSLMGAGLWMLVSVHSVIGFIAAATIHGIGTGLLVPNAMAPVLNALSSARRGRGMGGFTACLYLGQFVSPLVVSGVTALCAGLFQAILVLASCSLALGAAWALSTLVGAPATESFWHHKSPNNQ